MSIINVDIGEELAIVISDSGAMLRDRYKNTSKVLPLMHFPAVIAGRGTAFLPAMAFIYINEETSSFDEAVACMPDNLLRAMDVCYRSTPEDCRHHLLKQEVMFVGWNAAEQRMRGYVWQFNGPEDLTPTLEIESNIRAPWDDEMDRRYALAAQSGKEGGLALAQIQRERILEQKLPYAACGAIFRTMITEHGIIVNRIGEVGAEDGGS